MLWQPNGWVEELLLVVQLLVLQMLRLQVQQRLATDSAATTATATDTDSATNAATDAAEENKVGGALKEATIGSLLVDKVADWVADEAFGFTVTPRK